MINNSIRTTQLSDILPVLTCVHKEFETVLLPGHVKIEYERLWRTAQSLMNVYW